MNRNMKKSMIGSLEKAYDKNKGKLGMKTDDPNAKKDGKAAEAAAGADAAPGSVAPPIAPPAASATAVPPTPAPTGDVPPSPAPPADGVMPTSASVDAAVAATGAATGAPADGTVQPDGTEKKKKGGILEKVKAKLGEKKTQEMLEKHGKTAVKRKLMGRRGRYGHY